MTKGRPPRNAKPVVVKPENLPKITCLTCGTTNQKQFYVTKDSGRKYFARIPYCKECIAKFYSKYLRKYEGNMNLAVYYLCRKIDIPYVHDAYESAVKNINNPNAKIQGEENIVSAYMKTLSFAEKNNWGFTFDDSQGEREINGLTSYDEVVKIKRILNEKKDPDESVETIEFDADELVQKWGYFSNEDLAYLESEYMDWNDKLNGIMEKSTDIMVKQVCLQCNEIRKDRENGTNVDKKLATLQNMLKTSGLIEAQDSTSEDRHVGMLINDIEFKRPVKNVDPDFEDVDGIRDIIYGFTGAMCRSLGKENFYTKKFDEIYGKYSIDIINDLRTAKELSPDVPLEEVISDGEP